MILECQPTAGGWVSSSVSVTHWCLPAFRATGSKARARSRVWEEAGVSGVQPCPGVWVGSTFINHNASICLCFFPFFLLELDQIKSTVYNALSTLLLMST